MTVEEQVGLAGLTTFGVGGAARWFCAARSEADVAEAVAWARERSSGSGVPLFVLGGGSNLLVRDEGFRGLVMRMEILGIEDLGGGEFWVGAGESWDGFVTFAVERGLAGIECLAGIPGSVGGTPVQNVGAYGQEVSETILEVRAFDLKATEFVTLSREACRFRYRESLFNTDEQGRYVVTRVRFGLRVGGEATLKYAELREKVSKVGPREVGAARSCPEGEGMNGAPGFVGEPGLVRVSEVVREIRLGKGMLLVEGDADTRSAGSFFKNPVVSVSEFEVIKVAAGGVEVPHWPTADGRVKLAAAWLLEQSGFVKGFGEGRVGISSRHTLALVNRGGASFADVAGFEAEVVRGVRERFGVGLVREPVVVG